ncbi:Tyrosine-protein kinase BTK [Eumeta japonica]|uniref:Tyrosine-protein kinase BTK n=1 Tax=Eumeta variegata TaxID=151549 RepID=A0A4C1U5X0_EUMVA|nr:Tyrosine-protein kinase BTK [Eumeta japonica]
MRAPRPPPRPRRAAACQYPSRFAQRAIERVIERVSVGDKIRNEEIRKRTKAINTALIINNLKGSGRATSLIEPITPGRNGYQMVTLNFSLEQHGAQDLAARNILVDGAGVLKVADFGLSRSGVYVHSRARPVPLRWLAPEAIVHSQYSSATDVWAYAVLLWEIATLGGFPYAELSNYQVPPFLSGGGRLPKPARASQRLYELMVTCWNDDPSKRPTFELLVAKLKAQQKLYVDLDNVFTNPDEDYSISDMDFEMKSNDSATS